MSSTRTFGMWSGVGLVIANMVGAGVFLSTGFMSQSLTPGLILLNWLVGGVLAMCGARAYAEVSRLVPQGGGEYRFLSTLIHPALGYVAGWGSLLLGFSAPIAVDALAAGAFARSLFPTLEPRIVAAVFIVALTALHAVGLSLSSRVQNVLVGLKVLLLFSFVVVGLTQGSLTWPTWVPPNAPSLDAFTGSLFFVAFAYSGWNAAVYAAEEFKSPERDVPRAMLIGCLAVGSLYLIVNAIFVANLTPTQGSVVFNYSDFTAGKGQWDQVTLGQAVMAHLLGPTAAKVMSGVMVLLFASAMSAMIFVGPRVTAAMAKDGVLPAMFGPVDGKPPLVGLVLQAGIALLVTLSHDLRSILENVGAVLVLFAALTAGSLFAARLKAKTPAERPALVALICAGVYVLSSAWMLYSGFKGSVAAGWTLLSSTITDEKRSAELWAQSSMIMWAVGACTLALIAYFGTRRFHRSPTS